MERAPCWHRRYLHHCQRRGRRQLISQLLGDGVHVTAHHAIVDVRAEGQECARSFASHVGEALSSAQVVCVSLRPETALQALTHIPVCPVSICPTACALSHSISKRPVVSFFHVHWCACVRGIVCAWLVVLICALVCASISAGQPPGVAYWR